MNLFCERAVFVSLMLYDLLPILGHPPHIVHIQECYYLEGPHKGLPTQIYFQMKGTPVCF